MANSRNQPVMTHAKIFAVALFCHAVFFATCAFTFSSRLEPQKPALIFLGSLLKKYDLRNTDAEIIAYTPNEIPATTMTPRLSQEGEGSTPAPVTDKPLFDNRTGNTKKRVFKPPLDIAQDASNTKTQEKTSPGESTVPARLPLKLDIK